MKKLKNILISLVATISLTSAAYAGSFGLGVTGSYTKIDASGSETSKAAGSETETNQSISVDNNAFIGKLYVEYSFDDASWGSAGNGITFGANYTPGTADVSDRVKTRTDVADASAGTADNRTSTAQAEIENYMNYYIELPLYKSIYVKAGMAQVDVNTLETSTLAAAGKYGNKTLDGTNLGIGFKGATGNNIVWKLAYEETNFDTLNLTSTTGDKIKADLDTSEVNLSIGYRF